MGRNANGRSSIYENAEGWHGRVTVGVKDDGCGSSGVMHCEVL